MHARRCRSQTPGLLLLLLLLVGCRSVPPSPQLNRYEFQSPYMGMLFRITLFAPDSASAVAAADAAFRRISALEDTLSDYQADSELNLLCEQAPGRPVSVSADLFEVLRRAQQLSEASGGAFDVTAGPYVRLWRFARKRKVLPSEADLAAARASVGYQNLVLDARSQTVTLLAPDMRLDVGGLAKGYAADQALQVLKGRGLPRALVAASGDIAIGDPPPGRPGWRIAISSVEGESDHSTPTLCLHNAGISTSGDTEQFIEIDGVRYSHIVNPATALGLTNRIQATVVAPDATTSDPLATTVCILGPQKGMQLIARTKKVSALIFTREAGETRATESPRFKRLPRVE